MIPAPLFALADAFLAQAASGAQPDGPPAWTMFIYIGLFIAVMYFVMIRPQQTMKKKQEELISAAKSGDRVTTSGGIIGVVTNVRERTFLVRIADNVKIEVLKSAIASVDKAEGKKAAEEPDLEDEADETDTEDSEAVAADGKSSVPRNRSKKRRR